LTRSQVSHDVYTLFLCRFWLAGTWHQGLLRQLLTLVSASWQYISGTFGELELEMRL
jgi:hypothetical protein